MLVGNVMLTLRGHCTCVQDISTGVHREILCACVGSVGERYVQVHGSKVLYKTIVGERYVGECCMTRILREVLL